MVPRSFPRILLIFKAVKSPNRYYLVVNRVASVLRLAQKV